MKRKYMPPYFELCEIEIIDVICASETADNQEIGWDDFEDIPGSGTDNGEAYWDEFETVPPDGNSLKW